MTTSTPPPDFRPAMNAGIDAVVELAHQVRPEQHDHQTPCDEFTLIDLLGHIDAALGRMAEIADRQPIERSLGDSPADPNSFAHDIERSAAATKAGWRDDALLDEMLTVPFGTKPGRIVAAAYASEMLVHAWDVAQTIGVEPTWPDDAVIEAVLAGMQAALPADQRDESVPFGEVTPVDDDARAIDRLAAWTGRGYSSANSSSG